MRSLKVLSMRGKTKVVIILKTCHILFQILLNKSLKHVHSQLHLNNHHVINVCQLVTQLSDPIIIPSSLILLLSCFCLFSFSLILCSYCPSSKYSVPLLLPNTVPCQPLGTTQTTQVNSQRRGGGGNFTMCKLMSCIIDCVRNKKTSGTKRQARETASCRLQPYVRMSDIRDKTRLTCGCQVWPEIEVQAPVGALVVCLVIIIVLHAQVSIQGLSYRGAGFQDISSTFSFLRGVYGSYILFTLFYIYFSLQKTFFVMFFWLLFFVCIVINKCKKKNVTLQKKLDQLPAVDMQKAPAKLSSKLHLFEYVNVLAQSLCSMHSDCASKLH
ncbi:hypothetical protein VP01_1987g3 [Puccinia sorghi]|uniref:Uncharacterized protein n=1 Tax=Puccinia sorghi TaxID=27349 RepID=A0A0L6VBR7_9BASI|nr:hypothetical protein VP01_1987g3 [Puccinia sorghi]